MKIGSFELTKKKTGDIVYSDGVSPTAIIHPTDANYGAWVTLYDHVVHSDNRLADLREALKALSFIIEEDAFEKPEVRELTEEEKKSILLRGLQNLMEFFKEFEYEPSFRFVNTLTLITVKEDAKAAKKYIVNYFSLMDNQYTNEIKSKIKSKEFDGILRDITILGEPVSTINNRFSVYFGSAGTGKTTLAMKETGNRCIVCNSSMLPADLMEDFTFDEGKPTFQRSALKTCMQDGLPIVFDEINLLPYDSLRFLQGILDGKTEIYYKGNVVHIKDGFRIIGTMNLSLGGMVYGLPEPLVDRCSKIDDFVLTASQLMNAITE